MAVSKRKKKPIKKVKKRKGVARVKAAQGGKTPKEKSNSNPSDPGRDLGLSDDILNFLSKKLVGGTQDELIAQGQEDFPGLNRFSNAFNTQHLATAENVARKTGPFAEILQKLGGGGVEVFEALFEDTNNPDRPGASEDTALDFVSNRIGREVGSASPEDEASVRARGIAELNRLRAGIQSGEIDPFQLQRDEAPIAGRLAQVPDQIDKKVIPGAARLLGVDANTNLPETVKKFFQSAPQSRPASSIPRGAKGGRMTAEAAESGRNVVRQHFAGGGFPVNSFRRPATAIGGSNTSPISGVDIPGITTLEGQEQGPITQTSQRQEFEQSQEEQHEESGTGFTQNIANTGALDNIVNQLQGVQGHSDLGRSTLDEILRTGLPTDVSGIANAAKIRGKQEFDEAQNQIGERLANLGLVSSSAQTSAVGRERAKLAERIAAAGMEAQVAADEAAAARRAGGVTQDTSGQGVRAGALGAAGSLASDSARLNSRQETGFSTRGTSSGSSRGTSSSTGTTSQSNPLAGTLPRTGGVGFGGGSGSSGRTRSPSGQIPGTGRPTQTNVRARQPSSRGLSGPKRNALIHGLPFKHGGRVPFADGGSTFISGQDRSHDPLDKVLQGIDELSFRGDAGSVLTREDRKARERGLLARFEEGNTGIVDHRREIQEFLAENDPGILRMLLGSGSTAQGFTGSNLVAADPGTAVTPDMQGRIDSSARRALAGARAPVPTDGRRQHFALGGPVEGDPVPLDAPNKGAIPQPGLPQENGQLIPGLLDPRRQFFEEGGGVAPGIDSGEDKVPAMLRAEELVVTPELVEELMNVDPALPQPGLVTALQQLAQQPLEFGEEEGEFVAADGGRAPDPRISFSEFLANLGSAGLPEGGFSPETHPELFGLAPFSMQGVDPNFVGPPAPTSPGIFERRPTETPEFAGRFLPGAGAPDTPEEFPEDEFDLGSGAVPGPALRMPSLTEGVGEAGERSFTLDGGSPGTGVLGEAGIRAGLDPNRGLVSGGENFAPGVPRGGAGSVSGSAAITDPETGLPMDFSGQQLSRLERAQRTADLTRSAIRTDPIGGPEKQARMLRALEIANREVDSSVTEIIQGQQLAIQRQQAQNAGVVAQGQLNASVADRLQAEAQKVTAEGAFAKQVAELAANNPVVTAAMNKLELLAKNPDMNPDDRERVLAILQRELQASGIELSETGFFQDFFGGPGFTISPVSQQQGVPDPNGSNDGQQELQAMMSRAKAGMSAEDFQHLMEVM